MIDIEEMKKRAENGDIEAQCRLGRFYADKFDHEQSIKWYRLAAEKGNDEAQRYLGDLFYYGVSGIEENRPEAAKWQRAVAERGYYRSQYNMGRICETGDGVQKDEKEAARWYRLAAEQSYEFAQKKMGDMYVGGIGVPVDNTEAAKWYVLAIHNGSTEAYKELVKIKDVEDAVKWSLSSAEKGDAESMYILGMKYFRGWGVQYDIDKAIELLEAAAELGLVYAQRNIGEIYLDGVQGHNPDYSHYDIIPVDLEKAFKWFKLAAEQNDAVSQFKLGSMYEEGKVVNKDQNEANRLYELAAEQNLYMVKDMFERRRSNKK